jgi:hypothetical protein
MTGTGASFNRLYGKLQELLGEHGPGMEHPAGPARGVVGIRDALDAILQVAAVIDEAGMADKIPRDRAALAGVMLMVVRDYVQPLPGGGDDVTADLENVVSLLRQTHAPDTLPPDWT